ncbi:MAG TPA: septal ring lytic transglycosylase RlpA family protein [Nitrospirae bacterium]|nr:septal ring lytic transglycosylase RlpA family protein [Nitrospirota bacterium]
MKKPVVLIVVVMLLQACASSRQEVRPEDRYMVASWYGKKFHGRLTASGERYNMYAHTAAHKTLPFGTRLKVTNPENGRSVVVKINDRGPFIRGRDIDLSYGAAKKIGLIGRGTARVRVEYLGMEASPARRVKYVASSKGPFTIQVASFRDFGNADSLKSELSRAYRGVYIQEIAIKGRRYFRVMIGKFSDRGSAERAAARLAREGYNVLVTTYREVL